MKTSTRITRIAGALAILLLVVSAVAATAAARPDDSSAISSVAIAQGYHAAVRPDDRAVHGVSGAQTSRSAASYYSKRALEAMGARYQAMAEYYGRPAASYYSAAALAAMGQRYQAQADALASASTANAGPPRPDDRGGILGPGPESVVVTVHSTDFSWRDATIGFVTATGCALLLAAAAVAAATRRRHAAATAS